MSTDIKICPYCREDVYYDESHPECYAAYRKGSEDSASRIAELERQVAEYEAMFEKRAGIRKEELCNLIEDLHTAIDTANRVKWGIDFDRPKGSSPYDYRNAKNSILAAFASRPNVPWKRYEIYGDGD